MTLLWWRQTRPRLRCVQNAEEKDDDREEAKQYLRGIDVQLCHADLLLSTHIHYRIHMRQVVADTELLDQKGVGEAGRWLADMFADPKIFSVEFQTVTFKSGNTWFSSQDGGRRSPMKSSMEKLD